MRVLQDLCFFAVTSVTTQSFIALKTEPKIAFKRRIPVTKIGYKANIVPNIYIKLSLITTSSNSVTLVTAKSKNFL